MAKFDARAYAEEGVRRAQESACEGESAGIEGRRKISEATEEGTRRAKQIRSNLRETMQNTLKAPTFTSPIGQRQPTNLGPQKMIEAAPSRGTGMLGGLRSFKRGGVVKKTGPAIVHAGEIVIPAAAALGKGRRKGAAKASAPQRPHKMIVDSNDDDSFSITHQFKAEDPDAMPPKEEKYSARNKNALVRHVRQAYGESNNSEQ
jgi:hypothetical protein